MTFLKLFFRFLPLVFAASAVAQTGPAYDRFFTDECMRIDYFHTGTNKEEVFSLDEIWKEPVWPGSVKNLVDTLNLGKYQFQVFDVRTNQLVFSRGFCSVFGEWETTDEARSGLRRTFSESIRFPWPHNPVRVVVCARDRGNVYQEKWSLTVDPAAVNLRRDAAFSGLAASSLVKNGECSVKVDIVFLPDGYKKEEMWKFRKDVDRLVRIFFSTDPFRSRKLSFNVWTVELASGESGIDNPNAGVYRDNAFGCSYNTFGSDRYALTFDNKTLRKAAALAPYDHVVIVMNDKKYGGGGIFNLYAICAADDRWSEYVLVHEFGHSFAGLGDEYYTSDVAYTEFYPLDVEPWETNITTRPDKARLKWKDLVAADVPVPTPWDKETFDSHQAEYAKTRAGLSMTTVPQAGLDSLVASNDTWIVDFLSSRAHAGQVGAFEGCGYSAKGLYRPSVNCRMFTRGTSPFCPVCRKTIERVIDFHAK
jgi:hypothetical protein